MLVVFVFSELNEAECSGTPSTGCPGTAGQLAVLAQAFGKEALPQSRLGVKTVSSPRVRSYRLPKAGRDFSLIWSQLFFIIHPLLSL